MIKNINSSNEIQTNLGEKRMHSFNFKQISKSKLTVDAKNTILINAKQIKHMLNREIDTTYFNAFETFINTFKKISGNKESIPN